MFSRLLTRQPFITFISPIVKQPTITKASPTNSLVLKRWSGHNAMRIEPSNWRWKKYKDMTHFYVLLTGTPILIAATIINIRSNPELTEIPDGYEPRDWEYHRHPVARFMARYLIYPPEFEHELKMGMLETASESLIMSALERKVEKVMKFYQDHRSSFFYPYNADLLRIDREYAGYLNQYAISLQGHNLDQAYDPSINPVPTAGYKPGETP